MPSKASKPSLDSLAADDLRKSGLDSVCSKLGVQSITAEQIARLPNAPPGPHNPGAYFPYPDPRNNKPLVVEDRETGSPVKMWRVKYLPPRGGKAFGIVFEEQKYTQPVRVGCPPYFPPLLDWKPIAANSAQELWITEGEKKGAAATLAGQPTIATGGVWNFRGKDRPLDELFYFVNWAGRAVVLVRDSDWFSNHNVRYAGDALAAALQDEGALVSTLTVPELPAQKKTGLDDFLRFGAKSPKEALALLRAYIQPWIATTCNDTGNALLLKHLASDRIFYGTGTKPPGWWAWNGTVWEPSAERALEATKLVQAQLTREAATLKDAEARKAAARWATATGNVAKRTGMLTAATAEMDRRVDELDAHPDLMNLANGVLNLATFELGPHDSRLMLTRVSPVRYDPKARFPEFLRFIKTILPSKAVRDYVQRLCGYYLMSGNPERIFTNWHGGGRNGKSQLKELALYVGGGYARATTPDTFLSGRRTGTVRDDLHALRGARLVAAVEPNKSAAMDEATVKEVTGGDAISTRALYGEHSNWVPDFKPLLVSNHKLVIRGTDDGIWDRLKIVPFSVRIADEDVVVDYFKNVLKPEASGYLNWALDGLRQYRAIGLAEPEEVRALVIEHREESDVVANFLGARCEIDEKFMAKDCVSPTDLKAAFVEYCRTQSIPYRDIDLRDRLVAMKHSPPRQSDKKYWPGIKLIKRKFEA